MGGLVLDELMRKHNRYKLRQIKIQDRMLRHSSGCLAALTLEIVKDHQHQRVAAQRAFAGVVDLMVSSPFLYDEDQGSYPGIS